MNYTERDYNFKQRELDIIGDEAQLKLSCDKILVIGAGGLGSIVLNYLIGIGIHTISIVEDDILDITNLHRQVLYTFDDIGLPKCALATQFLRKRNPFVNVKSIPERLNRNNIQSLFQASNLIIDCTDNIESRFLIHDFAQKLNKDLITGAVYKTEGTVNVFHFSKSSSPCLRCLWGEQNPSYERTPVLAPVVGIIASIMSTEAMKLLLGHKTLKQGETLILDSISMTIDKINWKQSENCTCS